MTNTALLYMNIHRHPRLLPPMSASMEILLFVAFEHVVIGLKCVHYGLEQPRIQTAALGHSLVLSLTPSLVGKRLIRLIRLAILLCFFLFSTIEAW